MFGKAKILLLLKPQNAVVNQAHLGTLLFVDYEIDELCDLCELWFLEV